MMFLSRTLLLLLFSGLPAIAQIDSESQAVPSEGISGPVDYETAHLSRFLQALPITEEISLDGLLTESAWDVADVADNFVQRFPRAGELALNQTEMRVLYDTENLYVGVICYDTEPSTLAINELVEDFNFSQSDAISVVIDSLNDDRSGFMFMTNPAGARRDLQIANNGQGNNVDWDAVWDVSVTRNDEGWIAEFRIPFKTLRFTSSPSQEWGLNLTRSTRHLAEESHWAPIPIRYFATRVSLAGTLGGLEGIRQGMNLNVKPFVTGGFDQSRPPADPFGAFRTDSNFDGGVDAKFSLTPSLTLDGTYRTDFAQVEADQQQVNLTRFNLFFPEKREFFLENSGIFGFGGSGGRRANVIPFFSRRIGLSSTGTPIPIIGGGRLSGRIDRYDVGILGMKTEDHDGTPSSNYVIERLKRNLLDNSWIGGILTSRDSKLDGDHNRVYGADAFFQFYNRLEFDSYVLGSDTPGLTGENLAKRFQTAWRDDEFVASAEHNQVQSNFNPEVGFVRRGDNSHYGGQIQWLPRLESSGAIRNLITEASFNYFADPTGQIETREQEAHVGLQLENGANANFRIKDTFDRLTEADQIQGIVLLPGDYTYRSYTADFQSDTSKKISGRGGVTWGEFWDGRRKSFDVGLGLKPNFRLNLALDYSRNVLRLANGTATTDLVGTRFVYGFSPRSFFNAFVQYNGARQEISTNLRYNITYRPLSDLYLVYNDRRSTDNGQVLERAFIVKLTNLISF